MIASGGFGDGRAWWPPWRWVPKDQHGTRFMCTRESPIINW